MDYIKSSNIDVFPASNRPNYPQSRLTTEKNIVNISNKITSNDCYVISFKSNIFKICMHGYYFEFSMPDDLTGGNIYAHIGIKTTTKNGVDFEELIGTDENDNYTGLLLNTDNGENTTIAGATNYYHLHLLEYLHKGSIWFYAVPLDSYIKFKNNESSRDIYIDDGDLDSN